MELIMQTNLERELPAVIDFNFETLKSELAEKLKYYKSLVVTEEAIKDAKEDKAKLNALRTALEDKRKEVKKQCLKPYEEFEQKMKLLVSMIDEPIKAIDGQLKSFDELRKEEKLQTVKQIYDLLVPDALKEIIPLGKIADAKWLNATFKIKQINEDIKAAVNRTEADLLALDMVEPEHAAAVRAKYLETLDIGKALAHRDALQKAAEAFKQRDEEQPTPPAEKPTAAAVPQKTQVKEHAEKDCALYRLRLEMIMTVEQAKGLKRYLADHGIDYRKI